MRKGWLIAAVLSGAASVTHAADVEVFGIHTPSLGKWAVYARISNPQSSIAAGENVAGLSSIAVDILNNTVAGTGTANVSGTATNTLPFGHTIYSDPNLFNPPNVGYGFWLLRSSGTSDATGIHKITAAQDTIIGPAPTPPYKNLILPGVGLVAGSKVAGRDFTDATACDQPVQ